MQGDFLKVFKSFKVARAGTGENGERSQVRLGQTLPRALRSLDYYLKEHVESSGALGRRVGPGDFILQSHSGRVWRLHGRSGEWWPGRL